MDTTSQSVINFQFVKKTGEDITSLFDDLAFLRITVFREFPYLYEGSFDYEKEYLKIYSQSEKAMVFAVYLDNKIIGATTCMPLTDEAIEVRQPFINHQMDISKIFYFGESLLLPPYRGIGLGHRFMDEREAHAASFEEFEWTSFCSVVRAEHHPLRPENYRPNDTFWIKRNYHRKDHLKTNFDWPDIGDTQSTLKPMIFWIKKMER